MKIAFDIKYRPQIESGEYKVVTSFGEPAEIVKWDCNGQYPLLACIFDGDTDDAAFYTEEGKGVCNSKENYLSIVTPEQELSEFELTLLDWLSSDTCGEIPMDEMKKCVKNRAAELLALARKEPCEKIVDHIKRAYENGKAEALKDLPRWRKWGNGACGNRQGIPLAIVKRVLNGYELVDALGIQGEQYIMLSDLKKLPGFNE